MKRMKRVPKNLMFNFNNKSKRKQKMLGSEIIPFGVGLLLGATLAGAAASAYNSS